MRLMSRQSILEENQPGENVRKMELINIHDNNIEKVKSLQNIVENKNFISYKAQKIQKY